MEDGRDQDEDSKEDDLDEEAGDDDVLAGLGGVGVIGSYEAMQISIRVCQKVECTGKNSHDNPAPAACNKNEPTSPATKILVTHVLRINNLLSALSINTILPNSI